jgi:hypothetical protein
VSELKYGAALSEAAKQRELQRLEAVSRSPMVSHFTETVLGATTIRAFDMAYPFQVFFFFGTIMACFSCRGRTKREDFAANTAERVCLACRFAWF